MLSADRNTLRRTGNFLVVPVAAGVQIFAGALVALDANGHAVPASATEGLVAAGRAEQHIDNRLGDAGDYTLRIHRGEFAWENSSTHPVTGADLLKDCYIEDDETVRAFDDAPEAVNIRAGQVTGIEGNLVWVITPAPVAQITVVGGGE